jgi:hypothetical protein
MNLDQFTGSGTWHRWCLLFPEVIASEGAIYLAEKAGAFWLLDAIASHEMKNPKLRAACQDDDFDALHFWYLDVQDGKAVLTCVRDKGEKPVVTQHVEFTDFPLEHVTIYAGNDGRGTPRKLFLPSEW